MKVSKTFFYFFLLFPFIKSDIVDDLNSLAWLASLYDIWKIVSIASLTYLFIEGKEIDRKLILIILFDIVTVISTVLNGHMGSIFLYIIRNIDILYVGILVFVAERRNELKYFIRAGTLLFMIYCLGNFITVLIFAPRGGMYRASSAGIITRDRYLLGSKNYQILFILPYICFSFINDYLTGNAVRKSTVILQVLSMIPLFVTNAATSIVGIIIFYFFLYVMIKFPMLKQRFLNMVMGIFSFCFFFFVVALNWLSLLNDLFLQLFQKNLNSQRVYIWKKYISAFLETPFWGHGYEDYAMRTSSLGIPHAHNQYLDILYQSGFFGLALLMYLIFYSLKNIRGSKIKYVIVAAIFAWLVMFQAEYYYRNCGIYIMIFLCINWERMEEKI